MSHAPVMLDEMLKALSPQAGAVLVDATFGGGGYSRAILDSAPCQLVGVDRDPEAVERGMALMRECDRFRMLEGCFSDLPTLLATNGISTVDGIVADIGVSSFQIDQRDRGFSFKADGPLDMRMSCVGETAADIINGWEEADLSRLFWRLGEEPESRPIARAIIAKRQLASISTTGELAQIVAQAKRRIKPGRDPATLVFQALRMQVNDELGELQALLQASSKLLVKDGKLVIVAFHSLEDRLVKNFINDQGGRDVRPSRHMPEQTKANSPIFAWAHRKPLLPSDIECQSNPRARSARLRVAVRQSGSTPSAANDELEGDMSALSSRRAA